MHEQEHALARKAVAQKGSERDRKGGREHSQESDHSHGERPAVAVGVDRERDDVSPVPDVEAAPGELEPTQIGVRQHLGRLLFNTRE